MQLQSRLFLCGMLVVTLAATVQAQDFVTGNLTLNYEANDETDLLWESDPDVASHRWDFSGSSVSLDPVTSAQTSITQAYSFDGGGGAQVPTFQNLPGNPSSADATWEFWLRPDAGMDTDQIFETGGSGDGMAFVYDGATNEVTFTMDNGGTQRSVSGGSALIGTDDFHQIVGVYDKDNAGFDHLYLYVDGILQDSDITTDSLNDWAGGDASTLGDTATSLAQGVPANTNFEGDMAIFRFYENALSADDITQNFQAVLAIPEPGSIAIWSLIGLALTGIAYQRGRRKQ